MGAQYDPNLELNPNPVLGFMALFVVLGFLTVFIIVKTGDKKPGADPAAAAAPVAAPAE